MPEVVADHRICRIRQSSHSFGLPPARRTGSRWNPEFTFSGANMKTIDQIYINGQFLTPHGTQQQELINPSTGQAAARVVLGDATDVDAAVAAAKAAYPAYSRSSKQERMEILQR